MADNSNNLDDLNNIPAYVENVHFEGITRTSRNFLFQYISDLFKCANFKEMILKSHQIKLQLDSLGIFSETNVAVGTTNKEDSLLYDITFDVKELGRISGSCDLSTGKSDSSMSWGLNMPNTFGSCEQLSSSYSIGLHDKSFSLKAEKPFGFNLTEKICVELFRRSQEQLWSGYKLTGKGISAEYMTNSRFGNHTISWEGIWRNLGHLKTGDVSFDVRRHFGDSLKSSLKHVFSVTTCEDLIMPSSGVGLTLTQELAGLGGNTRFISNDFMLRACVEPIKKYFVELTLGGGLLVPGSGESNICDRFLNGGPLKVRGFQLNGLGPSSGGAALGGDVYWTANAHLYFPFPFLPHNHALNRLFTLQTFVNTGALSPSFSGLSDLVGKYRLSAGIGVAASLANLCRFECNFVFPIVFTKHDRIVEGFQFGIGLNF